MNQAAWSLTTAERAVLAAALDALIPPEGSFPRPSECGVIDEFILRRVPPPGNQPVPYPGLDADGLRALLARLAPESAEMATSLARLEQEHPTEFLALWRLAAYGYYSRPATIAAIQRELAPPYHGAPLPLGYADLFAPWGATQLPQVRRGDYIPTEAVRRVDLSVLPEGDE
ncbi:MAG: hypothetical protein ACTHMA_04805 [Thermomicrobiales bacterium]